MNLTQSINNIVSVLLSGRIELPNGPMTAREHQQLAADVDLLSKRAQLADKLEDEKRACNEAAKLEVKVPEVPEENNEVEEDERT